MSASCRCADQRLDKFGCLEFGTIRTVVGLWILGTMYCEGDPSFEIPPKGGFERAKPIRMMNVPSEGYVLP